VRGPLQGSRIVEIALHEFDAFFRELPGGVAFGIAGKGTQLPPPGQHMAHDSTSLTSCRPGNEHDAVIIHHGYEIF
jgi:hypothetical protein